MSDRTLQAGERIERRVAISEITTSHNPRKSHRGLLEMFHEKGRHDRSEEDRRSFVSYIDENFPHIRERAESFKQNDQLQAVLLRSFRTKQGEEYVERYGIVAGEGRTLAWGLIEAETGKPQYVRAVLRRVTVDQAFEEGIFENLERLEMSPLDLSEAFHEMLTIRINPDTKPNGPAYDSKYPQGRPYTLKELAVRVNRDYHFVRSRAALVYLPDAEKKSLLEGKKNLTALCKLACRIKSEATGEPEETSEETTKQILSTIKGVEKKEKRRRVLPLSRVVELFDQTPLENVERLRALAEVMGIEGDHPLETALAERGAREASTQKAAA